MWRWIDKNSRGISYRVFYGIVLCCALHFNAYVDLEIFFFDRVYTILLSNHKYSYINQY